MTKIKEETVKVTDILKEKYGEGIKTLQLKGNEDVKTALDNAGIKYIIGDLPVMNNGVVSYQRTIVISDHKTLMDYINNVESTIHSEAENSEPVSDDNIDKE